VADSEEEEEAGEVDLPAAEEEAEVALEGTNRMMEEPCTTVSTNQPHTHTPRWEHLDAFDRSLMVSFSSTLLLLLLF
jgi:hypothetical protein